MTNSRLWPMVLGAVVASWLAGAPRWAAATLRWGDLQLSGNVQSQNLVRTPDPSTWEFIQNRNTARLRLDYDWLTAGKWITKYNIPFVESSSIHVLWRGVYDSIYDTTPGFLAKEDIHGKNYPAPPGFDGPVNIFTYATQTGIPNAVPNKNGQIPAFRRLTIDNLNLNSLGRDALDTLKFENELREMYIDLKFRGVPLSIRGGRQQVVWGETDNFRMLDRINALNLTWHFQQEVPGPAFGWDEIRRHYLVDNPSCRAQDVAIKTPQQRAAGGSCLVGGLDLPSSVRGSNVSFRDKIRDWEALFTLAAFSFYRGGSIVPTLGMVVDPVNQWNVEAFWAVDYVVRDDFVVNLAQRYYITPRGYSPPIFETWGVSGLLRGRSETSLRLTYQF